MTDIIKQWRITSESWLQGTGMNNSIEINIILVPNLLLGLNINVKFYQKKANHRMLV